MLFAILWTSLKTEGSFVRVLVNQSITKGIPDNKVVIVHLSKLWLNQTINTSTSPLYYSMTLRCTRSLVYLAHLITSCWILYHTYLGWFNEPPAVCTVDTEASVTLWTVSHSFYLQQSLLTSQWICEITEQQVLICRKSSLNLRSAITLC